jgi:hypothetical protein
MNEANEKLYDSFISQVRGGKLPSPDSFLLLGKINNDLYGESPSLDKENVKIKKQKVFDINKEDKESTFGLRSVPKYLQNSVYGVDKTSFSKDDYLTILNALKGKTDSSFKIIEAGVFRYNIVSKDDEKPFAYLDGFIDGKNIFLLRCFDEVPDSCELSKSFDDFYSFIFDLGFDLI